MGIGRIISVMGKETINGLMVIIIAVFGKMINVMDLVLYILNKILIKRN